jgi:hypothetical protein
MKFGLGLTTYREAKESCMDKVTVSWVKQKNRWTASSLVGILLLCLKKVVQISLSRDCFRERYRVVTLCFACWLLVVGLTSDVSSIIWCQEVIENGQIGAAHDLDDAMRGNSSPSGGEG